MKKRLIFLFSLLVVMCTSAVTVSVAWFIASNYLKISSFDLTINTSDDLQVSLDKDAEEYVDEISQEMEAEDFLIPVSSMLSQEWLNAGTKTPVFYAQGDRNYNEFAQGGSVTYVQPKNMVATTGYYQHEYFLKTSTDKLAYLDTSSLKSSIIANQQANAARADKLIADGIAQYPRAELIQRLNDLEKSMRVSILVDYNDTLTYRVLEPYKQEETLLGGVVDSDCKGMYDIKVGEDANFEVMYGEVKNREKIVYSFNQNSQRKQNPTWCDSGHYGNTYTIDMAASIENGVEIAPENSISFEENEQNVNNLLGSTYAADESRMVLIPLDAYVPTRIVITFYMEGWDKDNIDSTMGASFNAQLTFGVLDRNII